MLEGAPTPDGYDLLSDTPRPDGSRVRVFQRKAGDGGPVAEAIVTDPRLTF